MSPRFTRRALVASATAGCGLRAAPALAALAPPSAAVKPWFSYSPSVDAAWKVSASPENPLRFDIVPRNGALATPIQRILVLYTMASSAYDVTITEMLRVWNEKHINAHVTVLMDEGQEALAQAALVEARRSRTALIVAMGSDSTAWLWKHYRGGSIPVVSACAKDPVILGQMTSYHRGSATNFAFTSLNMPVKVQFAYLLRLRPNLRNLGILVDGHNLSAMETQAKPMAEEARKWGTRVVMLTLEHPNHARSELARLVSGAVADMERNDPTLENSLFLVTGSTSVFRQIATIDAHASRVPVISMVPEIVRAGNDSAVLSIGISFENNAHLAALYATRILAGTTAPGALPVGIVSPPDIAINFRKARDIGLRIPFSFFESASTIYDYSGKQVRPALPGPAG
ncbi:MAG: ABC transporter substrate-binding protein [Acetobacteraceae bacterium]